MESETSRTFLISGGASGMGIATAELLLKDGHKVIVLDLNRGELGKFSGAYSEEQLSFYSCDISSVASISESISKLRGIGTSVNGVFTNAGIHRHTSLEGLNLDDWEKVISINLRGTAFLIKEAVSLIHSEEGASIVLMGSDQCFVGKNNSFVYGASKGGIMQMTKALALDLASRNIRVNCVCPGTIDTPMARRALQKWADKDFEGDLEKAILQESKLFPLGRIGQPEEVGQLVCFLLSERSSFITGASIPVDGGYTAQ